MDERELSENIMFRSVFGVGEFVPMMIKQILSFYLYPKCNEESYLET